MLPAVIRGKKRVLGDVVQVTTFTSHSGKLSETGVLADYNPEEDEILVSFSPSDDGAWYSLDPNLDDIEFLTSNGKSLA